MISRHVSFYPETMNESITKDIGKKRVPGLNLQLQIKVKVLENEIQKLKEQIESKNEQLQDYDALTDYLAKMRRQLMETNSMLIKKREELDRVRMELNLYKSETSERMKILELNNKHLARAASSTSDLALKQYKFLSTEQIHRNGGGGSRFNIYRDCHGTQDDQMFRTSSLKCIPSTFVRTGSINLRKKIATNRIPGSPTKLSSNLESCQRALSTTYINLAGSAFEGSALPSKDQDPKKLTFGTLDTESFPGKENRNIKSPRSNPFDKNSNSFKESKKSGIPVRKHQIIGPQPRRTQSHSCIQKKASASAKNFRM